MGFLKMLGMAIGNSIESKGQDYDSDNFIRKICEFNPTYIDGKTKGSISDYINSITQNSFGEKYSVEQISMLKLSAYAKVFNEHDHPTEYKLIIKGINNLYKLGEEKYRPSVIGEAMTYIDY
jgi:hypothetical protein